MSRTPEARGALQQDSTLPDLAMRTFAAIPHTLRAHPWAPGEPQLVFGRPGNLSFPPQPVFSPQPLAALWGQPVTAAQHPGHPEGAEVSAAMGSPEKGRGNPAAAPRPLAAGTCPHRPPQPPSRGRGRQGRVSPFPRPHAMPLPECPLLTSRGWSRGRRRGRWGGLRWVPAGCEAAEGRGRARARFFFSPQECTGMDPVRDMQRDRRWKAPTERGDCCFPPEWVWGKPTSRQYRARHGLV